MKLKMRGDASRFEFQAEQYIGTTDMDGRLFTSNLPEGTVAYNDQLKTHMVQTHRGRQPLKLGDWVVRSLDLYFTLVLEEAQMQAIFYEVADESKGNPAA